MRTLFAAVLLALLVSPLAGCSRSEPTPSATAPANAKAGKTGKDPAAARTLISSGAAIVDVRTPDEYASEHLPNAINVPVDGFADHLAEVDKLVGGDKSKPIVVYCAAGARAARAKGVLDEAGYQHVVNGGGLDDLR